MTVRSTLPTPKVAGTVTAGNVATFAGNDGLVLVDGGAPGGSGITQLTGDVTAGPGSGSQAATLASTAVTPGTYGDSVTVSQITVDAKGRITSAVDVPISTGGTGTVTNTGTLTSGQIIIGNGGADIKVGNLSGDVTTAGGTATTLATTGVSAATYGDASNVGQFTVNAKGLITAAANVPITGGGSGVVLFLTTTLNHTQISALGTTPVAIVPAPSAGLANLLIHVFTSSDFAAGAYNNPSVLIRYTGSSQDLVPQSLNTLNNTTKRVQSLGPTDFGLSTSAVAATAINISTSAGVTGGNAANQYRIAVAYLQIATL